MSPSGRGAHPPILPSRTPRGWRCVGEREGVLTQERCMCFTWRYDGKVDTSFSSKILLDSLAGSGIIYFAWFLMPQVIAALGEAHIKERARAASRGQKPKGSGLWRRRGVMAGRGRASQALPKEILLARGLTRFCVFPNSGGTRDRVFLLGEKADELSRNHVRKMEGQR